MYVHVCVYMYVAIHRPRVQHIVCMCILQLGKDHQWWLQGGFWKLVSLSLTVLLKVKKATTLTDNCNFVRGHATLTTFTMTMIIVTDTHSV